MQIGKILNNEFVGFVDIRMEFPNVSFPVEITASLLPDGYVEVTYETLVQIEGKTAYYAEQPTLEEGKWVIKLVYTDIPVYVPQSVSPRQIRRALHDIGKLTSVVSLLENIEDLDLKTKLNIDWEYATEFIRNNEFIVTLTPMIDLDETAVDNLFIAASKIAN